MTRPFPNNQVGVGIVGKEAFVTILPGLSPEEVKVLNWAGTLNDPDEAKEVDETGGIVGIEQAGSMEERITAATRKAVEIARTINALKLREEIMVVSAQPVDLTEKVNAT
jgi:hypothetical protein